MQHRIHEVARRIARKWPSGAIGAVRPGREPEDEYARLQVPESRARLAPIVPVEVPAAFLARDLFPPRHQARTALARRDLAVQFRERDRYSRRFRGHVG